MVPLATFPGVIVHEWAHQLLCHWFGVKVIDVSYLRFQNLFVTAQVQIGRSGSAQGGEPAFGVLGQGLDDVPTLLFRGRQQQISSRR